MKSRRMTLRLAVLLGAVLLLAGIALAGTGQAQTSQPQPTPAPFPTPSARKDLSVEQLVRQSGCLECHGIDQKITGPSFRDMAARYRGVTAGYVLSFMGVAGAGDLPQKRKASVVVALLGDALHVRIFDPNGNIVVDRDEAGLVRGPVLADLKQRLIGGRVPDAAALSPEERQKILQGVFAAAGYSPARD
ncbi:MAG: c-type cytochrome, partial [Nitrososphaerales archaeon]